MKAVDHAEIERLVNLDSALLTTALTSIPVIAFEETALSVLSIGGPTKRPAVIAAFHVVANRARAENKHIIALRIFSILMQLELGDPNVRLAVGECLLAAKQLPAAYEVLRPVITAVSDVRILWPYAKSAFEVRKYDDALDAIQRLISLGYDGSEVREFMAKTRTSRGQARIASAQYERDCLSVLEDIAYAPITSDIRKALAASTVVGFLSDAVKRLLQSLESDGEPSLQDARLLHLAGAQRFIIRLFEEVDPNKQWKPDLLALIQMANIEVGFTLGTNDLMNCQNAGDALRHASIISELFRTAGSNLVDLRMELFSRLGDALNSADRWTCAVDLIGNAMFEAIERNLPTNIFVTIGRMRSPLLRSLVEKLTLRALSVCDYSDPILIDGRISFLLESNRFPQAMAILKLRTIRNLKNNFNLLQSPAGEAITLYERAVVGENDLSCVVDGGAIETQARRLMLLGRPDLVIEFIDGLGPLEGVFDAETLGRVLELKGNALLQMGFPSGAQKVLNESYKLLPAASTFELILLTALTLQKKSEVLLMALAQPPNDNQIVQVELEGRAGKLDIVKNRIFYVITWFGNPSSLINLLNGIYDDWNYYFISVGGNSTRCDVDRVMRLAQFNNIFVFNGAPASWGGKKLLFENIFKAMETFLNGVPECDWLQVICNQTYPLKSQTEIRELLSQPENPEINASPPPSFKAGRGDRPGERETAIRRGLEALFRSANLDEFDVPQLNHFSRGSLSVNFSSKDVALDDNFKSMNHSYRIKASSVDMRDMALGRFTEFSDVIECGATYTKFLDKRHALAVSSILDKYTLYTGDPFVIMSREHAIFLNEDMMAHELYVAMAHQFAPEMNYFDTVRMNSPFSAEPAHSFFRGKRPDLMVEEADIEDASRSAKFFTRKITTKFGAAFAGHFSRYIAAKRSVENVRWSATRKLTPTWDPAVSRRLDRLVRWVVAPDAPPWWVRDLTGQLHVAIRPLEDGTIVTDAGEYFGSWRFELDGSLSMRSDAWNTDFTYGRFTVSDGKLTLLPDGVVFIGNDWGRLLSRKLDMSLPGKLNGAVRAFGLTVDDLTDPDVVLRRASNELNVTLAAYADEEVERSGMLGDVARVAGVCEKVGRSSDGSIIARYSTDEGGLVFIVCRITWGFDGQRIVVFRAADPRERAGAFEALTPVVLMLDATELVGKAWRIRSRNSARWRSLLFLEGGRVRLDGAPKDGEWRFCDDRIVLYDLEDWSVVELPEINWTESGWQLLGFGQLPFGDDDYLRIEVEH